MGRHNAYREDTNEVYVCKQMCSTCIFRPDSVISRERVEEMIASAQRNESAIICHHSIGQGRNAVCRGFFERRSTLALRLAMAMGIVKYVDPDATSADDDS